MSHTVAFIATDGVEEIELTEPWRAVQQAGFTPVLLCPSAEPIQAVDGLQPTNEYTPDALLADAHAEDYAAIVLPGGVANPDHLRHDEHAIRLIQETAWADRPVAAICHAPWLLIEAGLVGGRSITAWPSLETDVRNASGAWVDDQPVVIDGPVITSRGPDDLGDFCAALTDALTHPHEHAPVLAVQQSRAAPDAPSLDEILD